jgi:hypothetical protein
LDYNKKQEEKFETAGMKFFMSIAGYTGKDQINIRIMEKLNIFYLNNNVLKSRSLEKSHSMNRRQTNSKANFYHTTQHDET